MKLNLILKVRNVYVCRDFCLKQTKMFFLLNCFYKQLYAKLEKALYNQISLFVGSVSAFQLKFTKIKYSTNFSSLSVFLGINVDVTNFGRGYNIDKNIINREGLT